LLSGDFNEVGDNSEMRVRKPPLLA